MAYTDGKAAPRRVPGSKPDGDSPAPAPKAASNQVRVMGQTGKFRTYSETPNAPVGNQIRIDRAGKGLGVAGRPSAIATAGKLTKDAAVENPSGSRSKAGGY